MFSSFSSHAVERSAEPTSAVAATTQPLLDGGQDDRSVRAYVLDVLAYFEGVRNSAPLTGGLPDEFLPIYGQVRAARARWKPLLTAEEGAWAEYLLEAIRELVLANGWATLDDLYLPPLPAVEPTTTVARIVCPGCEGPLTGTADDWTQCAGCGVLVDLGGIRPEVQPGVTQFLAPSNVALDLRHAASPVLQVAGARYGLGRQASGRFLDLGGATALAAQLRMAGWDVLGCYDTAEEATQAERMGVPAYVGGVDAVQRVTSGEALWDCIAGVDVLRADGHFGALARLLGPSGVGLLATPVADSWQASKAGVLWGGLQGRSVARTMKGLEKASHRLGLRVTDLGRAPFSWERRLWEASALDNQGLGRLGALWTPLIGRTIRRPAWRLVAVAQGGRGPA